MQFPEQRHRDPRFTDEALTRKALSIWNADTSFFVDRLDAPRLGDVFGVLARPEGVVAEDVLDRFRAMPAREGAFNLYWYIVDHRGDKRLLERLREALGSVGLSALVKPAS